MDTPQYRFCDSATLPWEPDPTMPGIEIKRLGTANGQAMELNRYAPHTAYPAHVHKGAEFVFVIEGSARLAGQWLHAGWSSVGAAGTLDRDFVSGEDGCVFLAVYTP